VTAKKTTQNCLFSTKNRLFLTQKTLIFNEIAHLKKNRFNSTKTSRINIIFTYYSELLVSLRILQQLRSLNYLKKNIIRNRIQLQHISSKQQFFLYFSDHSELKKNKLIHPREQILIIIFILLLILFAGGTS